MQKLKFEIDINAPAEKVWNVLWEDKTYREWTKAFGASGYAKTDWKEGSRVHFVAEGEGGSIDGMYAQIEKLVPNKEMHFKHLGVIKNGEEQPLDDESRKWTGAMEQYYLTEQNGRTHLVCEIDMADDYVDMFNKTFPEAFKSIKELSEK